MAVLLGVSRNECDLLAQDGTFLEGLLGQQVREIAGVEVSGLASDDDRRVPRLERTLTKSLLKGTMPKARRIARRGLPSRPTAPVPAIAADRLLGDVRALIEAAREQTAQVVNSGLVGLYWHIGKRIREDVLLEKRAEYGEAIVSTLSKQLIAEYGRGYSMPNLSRMLWLAEAFPDPEIKAGASTLIATIRWRPGSRALSTTPIPPWPTRPITSYGPTRPMLPGRSVGAIQSASMSS
jgi:DUF1016 N-terminal domain